LEQEVQDAELKICSFVAEHNINFLAVDHLIPLLKSYFTDSKIAQRLQLKRTKDTGVVKNVISECEKKTFRNKVEVYQIQNIDGCVKTACILVKSI
jgi:hypothetical protein